MTKLRKLRKILKLFIFIGLVFFAIFMIYRIAASRRDYTEICTMVITGKDEKITYTGKGLVIRQPYTEAIIWSGVLSGTDVVLYGDDAYFMLEQGNSYDFHITFTWLMKGKLFSSDFHYKTGDIRGIGSLKVPL